MRRRGRTRDPRSRACSGRPATELSPDTSLIQRLVPGPMARSATEIYFFGMSTHGASYPPRLFDTKTWFSSLAVATALGLLTAFQRWSSYRGRTPLPSFWDHRFIHPQLIPWLVWGMLAPILLYAFARADVRDRRSRTQLALYVGFALLALLSHATVSGFALGWWWSFPSPIPIDPAWHIQDLLRTRTSVGLLVFALVAAVYHARVPAVEATAPPLPQDPPHSDAALSAVERKLPATLALKTGDRMIFVQPAQIDWIEADGDYVIVHVGAAHHRIRDTITAMERRITADEFIRVSRSAIVNTSAILEMQPWFRGNFVIILRSGARVTTGSRYRDRLLGRI